jgi:DNA repair exonuclease SbcCD ATPase subunit
LSSTEKSLRRERKREKELKKKIKAIEQAQAIVQELAKKSQNQLHERISNVVTKCLYTVYKDHPDGPCEFKIKFEKKRNKTEARLVLVHDGHELDPEDESSGGMIDVASFALRLACVLCSRPMLRRVVVLDEPFKQVELALRPIVAQLLMELAKETKTQIIAVTHFDEFKVGKVIRLS